MWNIITLRQPISRRIINFIKFITVAASDLQRADVGVSFAAAARHDEVLEVVVGVGAPVWQTLAADVAGQRVKRRRLDGVVERHRRTAERLTYTLTHSRCRRTNYNTLPRLNPLEYVRVNYSATSHNMKLKIYRCVIKFSSVAFLS